MSDLSPLLALPLLQAAQAQKHVTHNEALMRLDVVVQLAVSDRTLTAPPGSPAEGDRHIVASGATGAWVGQAGKVALWQDGVWSFIPPAAGWRAWVGDEAAIATYDGTEWKTAAETALTVPQLGVSTTADATNRLSVSAPATLLNHAGAGHQLKLNKAAAGDTASLLFQTGFSGRAEMGTTGSDDFAIKVSASGSGFVTALKVTAATAQVELAKPVVFTAQSSDPMSPADGSLWYNGSTGEWRAQAGGQLRVLDGQQALPWLTPASGEFMMTTVGTGTTLLTLAGATNRMDLYPFVARSTISIDALGVNCVTAVTSALAKMVIYASDGLGRPDLLVLETAAVDLSTTGNKTAAASATLQAGRTYWLGIRHSSNATLSAWSTQSTPDINGGTSMVTSARKLLRRTTTFATAAAENWVFNSSEIIAGTVTAIWLRQA